jgi:hypothetical protein
VTVNATHFTHYIDFLFYNGNTVSEVCCDDGHKSIYSRRNKTSVVYDCLLVKSGNVQIKNVEEDRKKTLNSSNINYFKCSLFLRETHQ